MSAPPHRGRPLGRRLPLSTRLLRASASSRPLLLTASDVAALAAIYARFPSVHAIVGALQRAVEQHGCVLRIPDADARGIEFMLAEYQRLDTASPLPAPPSSDPNSAPNDVPELPASGLTGTAFKQR